MGDYPSEFRWRLIIMDKGPVQKEIERKLTASFSPEFLEMVNESRRHQAPEGAESHFKLQLVSGLFEGMSRIERARRVHEVLAAELKFPVHALTNKLYSPSEWAALDPDRRKFKAIGHTKR